MTPTSALGMIGRASLGRLAALGRITRFAASTFSHMLRPPFYPRELANALLQVGWLSLPVVALTAIFTGGALALQIYAGGARFNAEAVVPQIVAIGMVRELGPVLVGLMIAARVTSSIAAEIATMRVTEQIDALVTLSTHPMKYLVAPRVLAALLTVPALVGVGDIIGIMPGLCGRGAKPGFQLRRLSQEHSRLSRAARHRLLSRERRSLWHYRRHHGMLLRHAIGPRCPRCRACDQRLGRGRRRADPCSQFRAYRGVFL
ncbi:MAG: hypothetical protein EpisKO_27700 [Epibacterium sp.]